MSSFAASIAACRRQYGGSRWRNVTLRQLPDRMRLTSLLKADVSRARGFAEMIYALLGCPLIQHHLPGANGRADCGRRFREESQAGINTLSI